MGINGSHKLLTYWLTDVTIKELFAIATIRCESALQSGIERNRKPTIDVDISWVYRRSSCAGKDALEHTFNICLELVKEGFVVGLICDGSKRHYTKRATIARQVKQYKSQLSIFEKRTELMQLAERRQLTDSLQERESYETDEKSLSNSIKRMENIFQAELIDVGQCLYDDLQDAIALLSDEMIGETGGYMTCYQAKYQADSTIAYRAIHGISDVVLMNDSDLAAHVGNNCIGIKDFKFIETSTGNSLREMQLFSPSYDTIRKVAKEIGVDVDKSKHRIRKPEFPVFENIYDIKIRCLMAVGLGCDVTASKNVKGVTARSLWLFLQTFQPTKEYNVDVDPVDLDPPKYTSIRTALCHLNLLIPNTDPSYSTESYIGFRLLYLREDNNNELLSESHIQQLFLDVQESLSLADSTIRTVNKNNSVKLTEPPPVEENAANVINDDHNLMELEIAEHVKPKKNHKVCRCAIDCCNNIEQELVRVPPVQNQKQFTTTTSADIIKTYFKKTFLRKEWLRRINLNPNDTRKDLRICKSHILQQMNFTIPWKNKEGSYETFDTLLVVPRMDHEAFSKTRTDKRKRPVYVRTGYNNQRTQFRTAVNNVPKNHRKCAFIKCTMQEIVGDPSKTFRRVPPIPKLYECTTRKHLNNHRKREAIRKFFRSEFLRRIGLSSNEKRKDLRICSNHLMEILPRSIDWFDMNNKRCTEVVNFPVPAAFGPMSDFVVNETSLRSPKGVGITRQTTNYMNNALALSQQPGNNDLSWGIALGHSLQDEEDRNKPVDENNPNIANNRRPIYFSQAKIKRKEETEDTAVRLSQIIDRDVRNETGYRTKQSLLSTIIILYNGDIKRMCKTVSQLTWFEEWYFVFEKIWGKANKRYFDVEKKYKRSAAILRLIYDAKMEIILEARRRWPKYATMNEDSTLRNNRWNKHYAGKRVVMWDNTNIRLYKAANAEAQRNTYSTYYAGNVGKGAVFVQLCGWMGTHELWCGAVSDSEYMIRSGVLEQQNEYVPRFDPEHVNVPFINILDKGYRINSAAWRTGGQFVLQPAFAKSDRKFNALDVIRSAAVASDRGGNERAVRIAKLCGSLKDGLNGHDRPDRLCELWLGWSFLANFMFKPVL